MLDLLAGAGIQADLATATASPLAWLIAAHPEILPVSVDGRRLAFGARQSYCPSAAAYREAAADLAGRMAERYGQHPAVAMWHIGNEYGCHVPGAGTATAQRRRSGAGSGRATAGSASCTRSGGGAVWSQDDTSWGEVEPPRAAPTFINPAQQLDFARFSCDELLACYRAERAAVAVHSPDKPVTTNFMGLFRPVDQFLLGGRTQRGLGGQLSRPGGCRGARDRGHGLRPDPLGGRRAAVGADGAGPERGELAGGERSEGAGPVPRAQPAGGGPGSDAVLSFQWRAASAGAEKFHSGMLPLSCTDSRVWREVVSLGADLRLVAPVAGSVVAADAALLLDWQSWWALELDSHRAAGLASANCSASSTARCLRPA